MKIPNLYVRLLLMFLLVMIVTLVAPAVFTSQIVKNQLQTYIESNQASNQRLTSDIHTIYTQTHNARRIQSLVEQDASQIKARILVVDASQHIIADSSRQITGQTLTTSLFLTLDNNKGNVDALPFPALANTSTSSPIRIISTSGQLLEFGRLPPPATTNFIDSINHSLILTTLFAGFVALVLAITFSSAILKPIRALTHAARRMEQGDLSQRVKVKRTDEIGDLAHAFNVMAESLQRLEQLQRNMISDIAHELRTPLTNVRGYLEALQDQVIEPEPQVITSIHEETMLLSRLVEDLQDLTLAEAGQLHLQCVPVALEDIIAAAINSLRLQASEKQLALSIGIPATGLPLVEADPQRVGQILRNLLSNAIKHTPAQGAIHVSTRVVQQRIEVSIQDTGASIPAEHLPSLFKRFYRVDASRSRTTGGTGLGLAIVEKLVHAHGGQIRVQSQLEQGTCFTFTLLITQV